MCVCVANAWLVCVCSCMNVLCTSRTFVLRTRHIQSSTTYAGRGAFLCGAGGWRTTAHSVSAHARLTKKHDANVAASSRIKSKSTDIVSVHNAGGEAGVCESVRLMMLSGLWRVCEKRQTR